MRPPRVNKLGFLNSFKIPQILLARRGNFVQKIRGRRTLVRNVRNACNLIGCGIHSGQERARQAVGKISLIICLRNLHKMAPPPWASDEQTMFLESRIDDYLDHQREGTLSSFWILLYEPWFQRWPVRDMTLDARLLSDLEKKAIASDLLKWRNVSRRWIAFFA